MFKQPKGRIEMMALMLPLPTEPSTEDKMNICTD